MCIFPSRRERLAARQEAAEPQTICNKPVGAYEEGFFAALAKYCDREDQDIGGIRLGDIQKLVKECIGIINAGLQKEFDEAKNDNQGKDNDGNQDGEAQGDEDTKEKKKLEARDTVKVAN
jgi:hypothetical protein